MIGDEAAPRVPARAVRTWRVHGDALQPLLLRQVRADVRGEEGRGVNCLHLIASESSLCLSVGANM